jgi:hypothetical protein
MVEIAAGARGRAIPDGAGRYRFGSPNGSLCVYPNLYFYDFNGAVHGLGAFELVQHLFPAEDAVTWVRNWFARRPGSGSFVPRETDAEGDEQAEIEAMAYIEGLVQGAPPPTEDTPGYRFITSPEERGLPLRPEDQEQLRWIANFRGEEGALIALATDDANKRVRLLLVHITPSGGKSPYEPARMTIRGARRPGLVRFGTPGPQVVEVEGVEKALAARAVGEEYVVACGGVSNFGKCPLRPGTQSVIIGRDDDPPGSQATQAMYRGVVRRLGQGLEVSITARPSDIMPKGGPFCRDFDAVWRSSPPHLRTLLDQATLDLGPLGDAVNAAILDEYSRLDALAQAYAKRGVATLLRIGLGDLEKALAALIKQRNEKPTEAAADIYGPPPWEHPITDAGAVLDDIVTVLKKVIAAPDTHLDTMALWAAHTHILPRRELGIRHSPRLPFQSQFEDSGKTTALTATLCASARPMPTSSLTGASMFREIDAHRWTIGWDEADGAFHRNTHPEMISTFNAGHSLKFANIHRQMQRPNGQFVTQTFNVFAPLALAMLKQFPSRAMQSRCIVLPMRRASAEEAARLQELSEECEAALEEYGRKLARWGVDLTTLPPINKKDTGLINRIWLNWRPLLQIARSAGGTWPARALAAARADMARVKGERDDSVDLALLDVLWRVLAASPATPRRMHTCDLVREIVNLDEGRWRTANKGQPIDEYYLREALRKLLPTEGAYSTAKSRRWRANPKSNAQYGYHELHLADAFSRYLGKGLPSGAPSSEWYDEDEEEDAAPSNSHGDTGPPRPDTGQPKPYTSSMGAHFPDSTDTSDTAAAKQEKSNTYYEPDDPKTIRHTSDTDPSASDTDRRSPETTVSSDTDKNAVYQQSTEKEPDVSDESGVETSKKKNIESQENKPDTLTNFPSGPVGRRKPRP